MSSLLAVLLATVCQHPALAKVSIGHAGGTCTLVATGQCDVWLTAHHVVQGQPNRVTIRHRSGTYHGRVLATGPRIDAAVIVTPTSGLRPAAIWPGSVTGLETVYAEGYGWNGFRRLAGSFSRIPRYTSGGGYDWSKMAEWRDANPVSGQSGGAIFCESDGRHYLCGVLSGGYPGGTWGCRATPLRDFLSALRWRIRNRICCLSASGPYMVCQPESPQPTPGDPVQYEPPVEYEPPSAEPIRYESESIGQIDYERLATLVAEKLPTPQRGPVGPQGDAGPRGPEGPPGKNASLDVDRIVSAVIEKLPKYSLEFVDGNGSVLDAQRPEFGGAFQIPVR